MSIALSIIVVLVRFSLLLKFFQSESLLAWVFGASEIISLISTVYLLATKEVDKSMGGLWVPVLHLVPLLTDPATVTGPFIFGVCWFLSGFITISFRLAMGRRCSVSVPVWDSLLSGGMYKYIRHPLSCVETFSAVCLCLYFGGAWNFGVGLAIVGAGVLCVWREEVFLRTFRAYREYCETVKYRWIPGVW